MGCDIHFIIEQKSESLGWVGIYSTETTPLLTGSIGEVEVKPGDYIYPHLKARNYAFFSSLAGVRGKDEDLASPLGVPKDASQLTLMEIDSWGRDGHSHSYASIKEFITKFVISQNNKTAKDLLIDKINNTGFLMENIVKYTNIESINEEINEYRVVYFFDN